MQLEPRGPTALSFDQILSKGEALLSGLSSLPDKKRKKNSVYDHGLVSSRRYQGEEQLGGMSPS